MEGEMSRASLAGAAGKKKTGLFISVWKQMRLVCEPVTV